MAENLHVADTDHLMPDTGAPYTKDLCTLFESNRDFLMSELSQIPNLPWKPLPCEGGYFVMIDIRECEHLIPDTYK